MRQFRDAKGGTWTLDLSFGAILRVKSLSEGRYDLLAPDKAIAHESSPIPQPLQTIILTDFPTLWSVVWMVMEPEARARGVTAEQFAESLGAAELIDLREKFREEWRDFFHQFQRPDQAMALEKMGAWMRMAQAKLTQAMNDGRIEKIDQMVTTRINQAWNSSSGNWEARLASTLGDTPGGN